MIGRRRETSAEFWSKILHSLAMTNQDRITSLQDSLDFFLFFFAIFFFFDR